MMSATAAHPVRTTRRQEPAALQNPDRCRMARPFPLPEGEQTPCHGQKPNKNAAFCTSKGPATPAIDAVAAEISACNVAPDAAQRAVLAAWCAADPGPIPIQLRVGPGSAEQRRRGAALRPGHDGRPALPPRLARVTRKPLRTLRNRLFG